MTQSIASLEKDIAYLTHKQTDLDQQLAEKDEIELLQLNRKTNAIKSYLKMMSSGLRPVLERMFDRSSGSDAALVMRNMEGLTGLRPASSQQCDNIETSVKDVEWMAGACLIAMGRPHKFPSNSSHKDSKR